MKMKTQLSNRILSLVLTLVMVMGMLPMSSLTAFAADTTTEKNITLGASHIEGSQASNVYFGTYKQSSDGNGGYNIDPIKWRVLSNADGRLFLLSDQNLDVFEYHKEYEAVTWETSTMRSWLNGLANNKGNGENAIDYTKDNFLDTAFSASEQTAIADTTVVNNDNPQYGTDGGNNTTDKVFLLSIEEAQNTAYGFTNNTNRTDTRKATNTAYVADGGKLGGRMYGVGKADYWRLRSPGHSTNVAAIVGDNGHVGVTGYSVLRNDCAVRPAFNINLDSVLFTSAAKDGKSSTAAVGGGAEIFENVDISTLTDNDGYKLTLLDSSRNAFEATISSIFDNTVTVSYSDAKTGDNEYISAIIKNGSTVKYYGRLGLASESGTATVTLPDDFNAANGDVLCIFNEQYNGDYKTDYASELIEIGYKVSFDANGGTGTMDGVIAKLGADYPLPANGFDAPNGYKFSGWATTANGSVISDTTITVTADTTLYAKWEPAALTGTVTITGEAKYGETLTATVTDTNNTGTLSYQWYRHTESSVLIEGATKSTYTITEDDIDWTIYCVVSSDVQTNTLKSNYVGPVPLLTFAAGDITASGYTGMYDGQSHSITVDIPDGAWVFYGTSADDFKSNDAPSYRDVGNYTVYYRVAKDKYKSFTGSAVVTITNAAQDAPAVTGVDETIFGKKDGKITGLTSAMEYRKEGESSYIAIQSEELTNLAAGTYYVRYAEKANYNASADTTVVIGAGRMLKVTVVNGDGYTITVDKTEFEYMGGFTITLKIAEGYSKTEQFDVLLNGNGLNWSEWVVNDVAETMHNTEDTTITVVGVADITAPLDTENTEKVEDVTAENVTPDDKTDLEKAKEDLEKALEEYGDYYTEDEKKAIEDEIKRIDDALEVIGNVEAVEEIIDKLPENITKDDEAAIKAADDAYNALSDYEKSLVDKDTKKALDDAKEALAELNKPADTTSPNTGDTSNMFLWIALLFISGGAVITLTVVDRKRKAVKR